MGKDWQGVYDTLLAFNIFLVRYVTVCVCMPTDVFSYICVSVGI